MWMVLRSLPNSIRFIATESRSDQRLSSWEILFFGDAPGYPGYYPVNFRVPSGVAPGAAVPVRLTYLGLPSNEVAIAVQ